MDLKGDTMTSAPAHYQHAFDRSGTNEQYRCLTDSLDAISTSRLAETGVTAGWDCLEVGCGGGSLARWLADRVSPTGSVLATDVATDVVADRPNLTVLEHDIRSEPLDEGRYDLVVARLVLQHLPQREAVLDALVRALKPGGRLQIDEFDTSYEPVLVAPSERAAALYEKFLRAKTDLMRAYGGDPRWGRQVAGAMRAAGLVEVDPRPHVRTRAPGSPDLRLQENHTRQLRDSLVSAGMTEAELAEVRDVMRDPAFCACSSIFYSVHGRKPC